MVPTIMATAVPDVDTDAGVVGAVGVAGAVGVVGGVSVVGGVGVARDVDVAGVAVAVAGSSGSAGVVAGSTNASSAGVTGRTGVGVGGGSGTGVVVEAHGDGAGVTGSTDAGGTAVAGGTGVASRAGVAGASSTGNTGASLAGARTTGLAPVGASAAGAATNVRRAAAPLAAPPVAATIPTRRQPSGSNGRAGSGRADALDAVAVRIDARDPISEAGVRMQLRARAEIQVTRPGDAASVVVAIADAVDEETTNWLRGLHRADGLPVVLVTGRVDGGTLSALVEAGVRGVLRRHEATADRIVSAVRAAANGHGDLPPELLRQLLDHLAGLNRQVLSPRGYSFNGITDRERMVLQLLADGLSTREVALRLSYSERTIKTVIQDLTLRLQLRNRTQAVAYALRNGWI